MASDVAPVEFIADEIFGKENVVIYENEPTDTGTGKRDGDLRAGGATAHDGHLLNVESAVCVRQTVGRSVGTSNGFEPHHLVGRRLPTPPQVEPIFTGDKKELWRRFLASNPCPQVDPHFA